MIAIMFVIAVITGLWLSYKLYDGNEKIKQVNKVVDLGNRIYDSVIYTVQQYTQLLSKHPEVTQTASGKLPVGNIDTTHLLSDAKYLSKASIVYILDKNGTVVACSPFGENQTLLGNNYSFRYYFTEAKKKKRPIIYPAVGVTTNNPGIYFSSPIIDNNTFLGVVVVKLPFSKLHRFLESYKTPYAITTKEGIIFATNIKEWLYKSLDKLDTDLLKKLLQVSNLILKKLHHLGLIFWKKVSTIKGHTIVPLENYYPILVGIYLFYIHANHL